MSGLDRRLTCFCMYDITAPIHCDVSGHWNSRKYFNWITSLIVSGVISICNWSLISWFFCPSINRSTVGTTIIMPGENIDRPNPQPLPSHIPDSINELQVKLQNTCLDQSACDSLYKFRRAAAYIAAGAQPSRYCWIEVDNWPWLAMIFLQDNTLLKRDIKHEDIKPRLLGKQLTFN